MSESESDKILTAERKLTGLCPECGGVYKPMGTYYGDCKTCYLRISDEFCRIVDSLESTKRGYYGP